MREGRSAVGCLRAGGRSPAGKHDTAENTRSGGQRRDEIERGHGRNLPLISPVSGSMTFGECLAMPSRAFACHRTHQKLCRDTSRCTTPRHRFVAELVRRAGRSLAGCETAIPRACRRVQLRVSRKPAAHRRPFHERTACLVLAGSSVRLACWMSDPARSSARCLQARAVFLVREQRLDGDELAEAARPLQAR